MDVQTFFFRRTNTNAKGEPRSWTDHLLWHHACHTVDLFQYQTGGPATEVTALQGPPHPELGIAMDMAIGLKAASGAVCTLSLSFNNDGPFRRRSSATSATAVPTSRTTTTCSTDTANPWT